ncbi:MAG TPA: lipid-binding SYLF domain-containing protein [Terriglobia bacterium]|jgi:lipid-binding SYLF domain-containing protein|nr:lipid-binding SYLF domain-containing protein [Terriglobia bacterium]
MRKVVFLCALLATWCGVAAGAETAKVTERLERSAQVVREILSAPDRGVPQDLLDKAVCIGVVPAEKKFAFGVGGSYGRGALVCRHDGTGNWGPASMIMMSGGSFGFQIGGESTDVLFIVMNPDGARKLLQDNVKLGADASVAAGPVGRTSTGATDLQLHAEILSYSRSRGLFAGISLSGAVVKQDKEGNMSLYGREIPAHDILIKSAVPTPAAGAGLDRALTAHSPSGGQPWSM